MIVRRGLLAGQPAVDVRARTFPEWCTSSHGLVKTIAFPTKMYLGYGAHGLIFNIFINLPWALFARELS